MERKSFVFYMEWRKQIEIMEDDELRRFITNLLDYHEDKEINLPTRLEKATWYGIEPALRINKEKYNQRIERNRENGRLGGRPKKEKSQSKSTETQNNPKNPDGFSGNPNKPDGYSGNPKNPITGNSKQGTDNGKEITGNGKPETEKSEKVNDNSGPVIENSKEKLEKNNNRVNDKENSSDYDFNTMSPVVITSTLKSFFDQLPDWPNRLSKLGAKGFLESLPENYDYPSYCPDMLQAYYYRVIQQSDDEE